VVAIRDCGCSGCGGWGWGEARGPMLGREQVWGAGAMDPTVDLVCHGDTGPHSTSQATLHIS
jgi:hypothetical protein